MPATNFATARRPAVRILMLIPSYLKKGIGVEVAADLHPRMDYHALACTLRSASLPLAAGYATDAPVQTDLVGYTELEEAAQNDPALKMALRSGGRDVALAMLGARLARRYDVVFTNGENIALPYAAVTAARAGGDTPLPPHVTIGHRLSTGKKRMLYRTLHLDRGMDRIFVYATSQLNHAQDALGIPSSRLSLIPFHADTRFWRPRPEDVVEDANLVSAAGLEWRDYPTLLAAAERLPQLRFDLAAASPWSKHANEAEKTALPANVAVGRRDYAALRDLYNRSAVVAVPLYENDFQAGVTTLLEAMACGKAVVVTQTEGQTDVVTHGVNGLTVAPGDVDGWVDALTRLHTDPALRQRLGKNARRWVVENAPLERWTGTIAGAVATSLVAGAVRRRMQTAANAADAATTAV